MPTVSASLLAVIFVLRADAGRMPVFHTPNSQNAKKVLAQPSKEDYLDRVLT
jgi:hypothetical protein